MPEAAKDAIFNLPLMSKHGQWQRSIWALAGPHAILARLWDDVRRKSPESPTSPIPRRHRLPTPKHFDTLAGRTTPFSYDPEADVRFEACRRHEDIFTVDASSLDEPSKVRLLLHKLDAVSYEKFSNYILPRTPKEVSFDQAVKTLKDLFGPQQSLFGARYVCMKLVKNPKDDFATYAGHVNRECAKFKLAECDHNQFKCLIFVCGLHAPEDAFIRLKLLDKIEVDRNCTIQTFTEECKRLLNLRHDTKMIEEGRPTIHSIDAPPSPRRKPRDDEFQLFNKACSYDDRLEHEDLRGRSTLIQIRRDIIFVLKIV
ncbi:unnamed protein product, partial [Heligmosomoides polygyrus]|uniref:DUF7083 domain-containing protein n=1 Tax=Heligmosomoides polygyrus TaxID=6339 RepID=A0A183GG38_HELPZ